MDSVRLGPNAGRPVRRLTGRRLQEALDWTQGQVAALEELEAPVEGPQADLFGAPPTPRPESPELARLREQLQGLVVERDRRWAALVAP